MDTETFIVYTKADDIYKDITENVETRFYTSNYELDRTLPIGKKVCWIKSKKLQLLSK